MIAGCFSAGGSMAHGGASCGGFTIRDAAPQHIRAIAIIQVEVSLAAVPLRRLAISMDSPSQVGCPHGAK